MIIRAQIGIQLDSAFPRDEMVITPHFLIRQVPFSADFDQLANDLAVGYETWHGRTTQTRVKIYDAQEDAPNFPKATKTRQTGVTAVSEVPRDVAVCLSYYSETNIPTRRGRLFLPAAAWMTGPSSLTGRPSAGVRGKAQELVSLFSGLGGIDVDWCVYSRKKDAAYTISNWWVDDEWDTQRSRGLRATTRTSGTTSG